MSPPYHAPFIVGEQTYAFWHLEPFQMQVESTKVGKRLRIHVRFMSHASPRNTMWRVIQQANQFSMIPPDALGRSVRSATAFLPGCRK
jgi:hypothetical protein